MTVRRVVVAVVHWTAVTGLALTTALCIPHMFGGPWADLPGLTAAAGICLIGTALAPTRTTRKARP